MKKLLTFFGIAKKKKYLSKYELVLLALIKPKK